jgi:4-hydroxy-tetrahydrodipicolinate synthase
MRLMMPEKKLHGVVIPMVSPLSEDYSVDVESLGTLCDQVCQAGAHIFVLGTTGEAPSLSGKQKALIVETAAGKVKGKAVLYAGISGNCLRESVDEALRYADSGADVAVAHVPFYYPADGKMVIQYYEKLAGHIPIPLVIYNIPLTTRYSIPTELVDILSCHPNIAGIKDSERNEERLGCSLDLWKNRGDFSFFAGWAAKSVEALTGGADGIIPGTGNLCPGCFTGLYRNIRDGNIEKATILLQLAERLSAFYQKGRTLGHSLYALKLLMSSLHLCKPIVLPPLVRMEPVEEILFLKEVLPELNVVFEYIQHEL